MKRTIAKHNDREIIRNLQAWIDIATRQQMREGKAWYKEAQKFTRNLSKIHKVDKYIVAAVTSALSPNNKWLRNKLDANSLIAAFMEGRSIDSFKVCTYNANKRKAWAIMTDGEEIAAKSPMAVWGTKQSMHFTRDHTVQDGLEYIANWNAAMFDTDDMGEAFTAQMEKRAADFPDLWPLSEGL